MQERGQHRTGIDLPSRDEADRAVARARLLFGRTLACWASDMLALRRDGMIRQTYSPRQDQTAWWRAAA